MGDGNIDDLLLAAVCSSAQGVVRGRGIAKLDIKPFMRDVCQKLQRTFRTVPHRSLRPHLLDTGAGTSDSEVYDITRVLKQLLLSNGIHVADGTLLVILAQLESGAAEDLEEPLPPAQSASSAASSSGLCEDNHKYPAD